MSTEALISRSVNIEGYINSVPYDETYTDVYGYWLCMVCKKTFYAAGDPAHSKECSLEEKLKKIYNHDKIIYVLGPNENGFTSPFKMKQIEKIKRKAEEYFLSKQYRNEEHVLHLQNC